MTRIGIVGLGRMGGPIARRLTAAGHEVHGHDLRGTSTIHSTVSSADVVLTILPGAPEFADVAPAVSALARPGTLWIDLTSNDPRTAERFSLAADHIVYLGAPMGGGPIDAAAGTLSFFASGAGIDRAGPVLSLLGTVDYLGPTVGAGYTAKLIANLLWFGQVIAVSEALLLGRSVGIPPETLRRLLPTTAGGSVFIDRHLDRLLVGDYLEDFGLDRIVDELEILEQLASSGRVPFELSSLVARTHRQALEMFGPVDGELFAAKLLESRAGAELRGSRIDEHDAGVDASGQPSADLPMS